MRLVSVFAFMLAALPTALLQAQDTKAHRSRVEAAAKEYAKEPSCENANLLMGLLPDRALSREELPPDVGAPDLLYGQVTLVESQMFHGFACAVRLAFRLRRFADAAFAEDLNAALGSLATTRPQLFLRELARSRQGCEVVAWFNADYSEGEARAERSLRLQRLRQPVPAALEPLRKQCLSLLEASPQ